MGGGGIALALFAGMLGLMAARVPIALSHGQGCRVWDINGKQYLDALAGRVHAALEHFTAGVRDEVPVIFTAHSLPERILEWNDPYADELNATVVELAKRIGSNPYEFAFQSAAISSEPWLGPDAGEVIERLASEGCKHVLIAPIGFVCEHVEVLYDVDIVYKQQAELLGLQLKRIEMLNTAPPMIDGLADLVLNVAKEKQWL